MLAAAAARPSEIARETLRQLALRKEAPTPENYRRLYLEIAGRSDDDPGAALEKNLAKLAAELPRSTPELVGITRAFSAAVAAREWSGACMALSDVIREVATSVRSDNQGIAVRLTAQGDAAGELRELLAEALETGVAARVADLPALAGEARELAQRVRDPAALPIAALRVDLNALWRNLEALGPQQGRVQQGLLELLRLLMENISGLVADDQWLRGQIAMVTQIISGPPSLEAISEAKHNLRDLIHKQGTLKQGLTDAKSAIKQMATSFVEQIGTITSATGEYHDKIGALSQQISQTDDIDSLNRLLDEVMRESRCVQESALRSRNEVIQAREKVDASENKIRDLESELENISEKAREDFLTGTMNRRGMNEALERAFAASDLDASPLCVALLDIDNFKSLNDALGHQAGDDALVHLAQIIKDTVRPGDVVARFGGEEFLILLPNAEADEATRLVSQLQRELTRRCFLHDNRKQLITFSAGVARRAPGEEQNTVIGRADEALYQAKQTGKNRVIAAP